ncbi:MAG: sterol desaturase/sphingolipid hydroxylase (fatty acid hydroxylase superfamily) [Roseivirga sp.]|jgi:sterol desaturase/sphingolipid hydroxylase (fatty acid hydroxylase superfamily)
MIGEYWDLALESYKGYANYVWNEITFQYDYKPLWQNYFWGLILVSLFLFAWESLRPWRKEQPKFRKDFWMDAFYMFFNFFLFSLLIFNALSDVFVNLFNDFLSVFGLNNTIAIHIELWPKTLQLFTLFLIRDFIQWWTHRLLHASPRLWEFHKVHHSVEQMGFAAHLRYHWMETIVYRTIEYIPLAMIGFGIDDFFFVHLFTLAVGHWNHANINVRLGVFKYIFNNPNMHMWHHAHDLPEERRSGVNFGLTLSVWDYLFKTAYTPHNGQSIKLGFPGMKQFPNHFWGQISHGFRKKKKE